MFQQVEHKRTFYFLEQLILKNNIHRKATKIEAQPDGLDFSFAERSDARTFLLFLKEVVPVTYIDIQSNEQTPYRIKESRQLLSQDFSSNVVTYKYSYMVNILPICKDDLIALPKKTAQELVCFQPTEDHFLQGMNPLCICNKVSNVLSLLDPFTLTQKSLSVERFEAVFECFLEENILEPFPSSVEQSNAHRVYCTVH